MKGALLCPFFVFVVFSFPLEDIWISFESWTNVIKQLSSESTPRATIAIWSGVFSVTHGGGGGGGLGLRPINERDALSDWRGFMTAGALHFLFTTHIFFGVLNEEHLN